MDANDDENRYQSETAGGTVGMWECIRRKVKFSPFIRALNDTLMENQAWWTSKFFDEANNLAMKIPEWGQPFRMTFPVSPKMQCLKYVI